MADKGPTLDPFDDIGERTKEVADEQIEKNKEKLEEEKKEKED